MSDFRQNSGGTGGGNNELANIDRKKTATNVYDWALPIFTDLHKEKDTLKLELNRLETKIERDRDDATKTIAVFVAFFTFISFSIQILPRIEHPYVLIGITLIILSAMSYFVLLLTWALDAVKDVTGKQVGVLILSTVLMISGVWLSWEGYESEATTNLDEFKRGQDEERLRFYTKEEVDKKINEYSGIWLSDFKLCLQRQSYWECLKN